MMSFSYGKHRLCGQNPTLKAVFRRLHLDNLKCIVVFSGVYDTETTLQHTDGLRIHSVYRLALSSAEMNFTKEQQDFLHKFQSLTFDQRLTEGTPSQKTDVLRSLLVQLDYYKKTSLSDEQTCSSVKREYEEKYASVVDSLDEQTGLNNFAEGALALCSGNKNESQGWKTSLSSDKIKNMKCIQKLREANKRFSDRLLPAEKRNQPLPFCLNKENIYKPTSAGASNANMKTASNTFPQPGYGGSSSKVMNLYDSDRAAPPVVERSYGRGATQERDYGRGTTQERDYGRGATQERDYGRGATQERDYGRGATLQNSDRANRKPLFTNTTSSNNYPDQFSGRGSNFGSGSRQRVDAVKRPHADYEENYDMEQDKPSSGLNVFKTAKEQLSIDQQKKYGGGGNRGGSLSTSAYGTQKKSLGTRRGPASRFVPPVMNREDEGNEAANTITRAVLKTGGGGGSSGKEEFNMEGLDQEKLKGIEPKMVELIMNEIMDNGHELTWDDIAGLEFAKKTIKEIVVWPMLRPDIFTGLRGPPKGLLLFGPPGTGKTLIGKCIASQSKSTFFCISASSLTSKWVGEGEKMVRALFAVARSQQPAVVFIDEIDSLLTQRTDGENEASRRIKTEFLVQLVFCFTRPRHQVSVYRTIGPLVTLITPSVPFVGHRQTVQTQSRQPIMGHLIRDGAGTSTDERILIIGATNRPQEIDEAARRRFVKRLYIPLPELGARRTIILNLLRQQSYHLTDEQVDTICSRTDGFSGADMATLCREAALGPIRDMSFGDIENISADQVRPISYSDFEDALMNVKPSVSEKDLDGYLDWHNTFGTGSR